MTRPGGAMRATQLFFPTLREVPSEAELVSHQLLLRGGFIRRLAAGVYSFLPLGWRVLEKIERIIRQEMDAIGTQELLLPTLHPVELWALSGRTETWGPELIRVQDRAERTYCLGATHEEVITHLVGGEVRSYRQLPLMLYQIQTKFRDEPRPRGGLIRGREFIMKDAYSFDRDYEGLDRSFRLMDEAYTRIFRRLGVDAVAVQAEAASMGGTEAKEFMLVSETGEASFFACDRCDYVASDEKADYGLAEPPPAAPAQELRRVETPGMRTIEQVSGFLEVPADRLVKTILYETEGRVVAALVRGDREINEAKLAVALGVKKLELASEETIRRVTGAPVGFAGPVGLSGASIIADDEVRALSNFVTGGNEADVHLVNVNLGRDFQVGQWARLRFAVAGDRCPNCDGMLRQQQAIELGHIFKLGTYYSASMGATYKDEAGAEQPIVMGSYGIGVSRLVAGVVEQCHDDNGIIWPLALAPFQAVVMVINTTDEAQARVGQEIFEALEQAGVEVLLEDRDERPGVKFKDVDLIGIPLQVVVGKRAAEGMVEVRRRGGGAEVVPAGEAAAWVAARIKESQESE